jgi:hypothetical protein
MSGGITDNNPTLQGVSGYEAEVTPEGRLMVDITGKTDTGDYVNIAVDDEGKLLTSGVSEVLSPLPGFVARSNSVLNAGASSLTTYTMTDDIAVVDFHFGGRGPGQASLLRISPSSSEVVPGGNFNSSDNVSTWTNAGAGSSGLLTWTYSTAQSVEGTGSATLTFTASAAGDYPAIKYMWSTPKDVSAWRYINASVYVTIATGGNQTRTASIILTDSNGATRTYQVSGGTANSPLFPARDSWYSFNRELATPDASTGTFDPYNVVSITLKMQDSGNKSGTIYWDAVSFTQSQDLIERIYIDANRTFQLVLNPVELFDVGQVIGLLYQNNDTVAREFTATAKGVKRT